MIALLGQIYGVILADAKDLAIGYFCRPMINGKKVIVVLPAYNAAQTLETTYNEIPFDIVDDVVLVDDASPDNTVEVGKRLNI
jgi:hypothetical protein